MSKQAAFNYSNIELEQLWCDEENRWILLQRWMDVNNELKEIYPLTQKRFCVTSKHETAALVAAVAMKKNVDKILEYRNQRASVSKALQPPKCHELMEFRKKWSKISRQTVDSKALPWIIWPVE